MSKSVSPACDAFLAKMKALRAQAIARGEEPFASSGIPDNWFDARGTNRRLWRCQNDHVSLVYIKSEAAGGDLCPECLEFVLMTFPGDVDGQPLPDTLPDYRAP